MKYNIQQRILAKKYERVNIDAHAEETKSNQMPIIREKK